MLVVADQAAVGVCRESGLTGATQTKEQGSVALLSNIGRAMHRHCALKGQPVIHQTENTLLVLATIPGAENDGHFLFDIECNCTLGPQP